MNNGWFQALLFFNTMIYQCYATSIAPILLIMIVQSTVVSYCAYFKNTVCSQKIYLFKISRLDYRKFDAGCRTFCVKTWNPES